MRPVQTSNFDALATIWVDTEVTRFLPSTAPLKVTHSKVKSQNFIE